MNKYAMIFVVIGGMLIGLSDLWAESAINYVKASPGASIINSGNISKDISLSTQSDTSYLWSRDTIELYWDDDTRERWYLILAPNVYMGVRFTPPGPFPMKVVGGRFYGDNDILPLEFFAVCHDAGGYPDVLYPIDKVENVVAPPWPGGWGDVTFNGAIFGPNDIWAVVHWIPGQGMRVGSDTTPVATGNSCFCQNTHALNWQQMTNDDNMIRLSVVPVTDAYDVAAVVLLNPPDRLLPGDSTEPKVVFGNCGLSSANCNVTFDIRDTIGNLVYTSTRNISLASCEVDTVTFLPEWVSADENKYTYKAYSSLVNDVDRANDTVIVQGCCSYEIPIYYCGDSTNWGLGISGSLASNRKFLVRMTPPVPPPYYLASSRIFLTEGNTPLEYLRICPDNGAGLPDTTITIVNANNVMGPGNWRWTTVDWGGVEITQPGDLWMIAKWYEGITEPHIGNEWSNPSSERSWRYYFNDGAGHYENEGLNSNVELYMTLSIKVPSIVGLTDEKSKEFRSFGLSCKPNPFVDFGTILSHEAESFIAYDVSGRCVGTFKGNRIGIGLAPGVYFIMSKNGNCEPVRIVKVR